MPSAGAARGLDSLLWMVRALSGVAGVGAGSEAYASGLGPLGGTLVGGVAFGLSYALLLGGVRRYRRLLEETREAARKRPPADLAPETPEPPSSDPPRVIRTRRPARSGRRLMGPGDPPTEP